MRSIRTCILLALCLGVSGGLWSQDNAYEGRPREIVAPESLTPPVIANTGQFDEAIRFIIPGPHGTVIFMKDQVIAVLEHTGVPRPSGKDYLSLLPPEVREAALTRRIPPSSQPSEVIRIVFVKGDPEAAIEGLDQQPARANYVVGGDPSKWARGIPVFKGVAYRNVWTGVDLIFKVEGGKITCTPQGADLSQVGFERSVSQSLGSGEVGETLSRALGGQWTVRKGAGTMIDRQGIFTVGTVYTPTSGKLLDRVADYTADCFVLSAALSSGEPRWITILGGGLRDYPNGIAVDRHGYVYVTGLTRSVDFPMAVGDVGSYFSAKLNPSGSSLAWATYLTSGGGGLGLEPFAGEWMTRPGHKGPKMIAITIDDGREEAQIKPFLDLGIPMTFAVLPWVAPKCIADIKSHDCAAFLHAPMEALGSVYSRGEEISIGQTEAQVNELLGSWLMLTPGVVGISNHRGSAATSDPTTMRLVASFAKKHGLFLYDSNTSSASIAVNIGREVGVPCLQQDFFLDEREPSLVRARLLAMADLAERTGYATCICHVGRPVVSETIRAMIPELQARGLQFVTVPELYEALTRR